MASLPQILDTLERHYGRQEPCWPTDPYRFLVWWHCGYPASDAVCAKGWDSLNKHIGVEPRQILDAPPTKLADALKPGGMVPELRAMRLKEIAAHDFATILHAPIAQLRKKLKTMPGISDPGADRILLFAGISPIAAVPSNCPQVLVRIQHGLERENYGVNYREAQQAIDSEAAATIDARTRAYLLLKQHGQELCKRTKPLCDACPLKSDCAYAAGHHRGVPTPVSARR